MTESQQRVYDHITAHHAQFGVSPSNRDTAKELGMSRQNVDKIVNKLAAHGYFVKPRKGFLVPVYK